jgi:hypothetical protein
VNPVNEDNEYHKEEKTQKEIPKVTSIFNAKAKFH